MAPAPTSLNSPSLTTPSKAQCRWDMMVSIGQPGDAEDDPTVLWPAERKQFKADTLSISAAKPLKGAKCKPINFDPRVMADGLRPSNDPTRMFRSPACAVSFAKRIGGQSSFSRT